MRLKLEGESGLDRIVAALKRLEELQPDGTTWHSVNLYLTLKDSDGQTIELELDGSEIDVLIFKNPAKRVPVKKPKQAKAPLAEVVAFPGREAVK